MTDEKRLSEYVVAEASPGELARQWQHIEARLAPRARRRWRPVSLGLAVAAIVALLVWLGRPSPSPLAFASAAEAVPVQLADGSRLLLEPRSRVEVVRQEQRELRLHVAHGGVGFEVRSDARRSFRVSAADLEVLVTGTAFTVMLDAGERSARVLVERGEVEVYPRGQTRLLARLHAGESWPVAAAPSLAPPATPSVAPPSSHPPSPAAAAPEPTAPAPPATRRVPPSDPRLLLEQANLARRAGDLAQAAALLETLRVRHPRDPRAALATFELGRLRMDALGDLPGAVQALRQAIALAPTGVFREDAEACLATAYARLRDRSRCEQARQAYLSRYPTGTHAAEVGALRCSAER